MKKIISILSILLMSASTSAETITLKSGEVIEGEIVNRTNDYIEVDKGIGTTITYFLDQIDNIGGNKQSIVMEKKEGEVKSITLKSGKLIEGNLIEQTDSNIRLNIIDDNVSFPYTYYFDELKFIDDKEMDIYLSSPVIQQELDKPFVNEHYGFEIIFPDGWYVFVGDKKIRQRINDIENKQQKIYEKNIETLGENKAKVRKKISTVAASEAHFEITPNYAAFKEYPDDFYSHNGIGNITMTIRPSYWEEDSLNTKKGIVDMMLTFTNGKYLKDPEILDQDGIQSLYYIAQYDDPSIKEQINIFEKRIIDNQMEINFQMMTKAGEFEQNREIFEGVINSLKKIDE